MIVYQAKVQKKVHQVHRAASLTTVQQKVMNRVICRRLEHGSGVILEMSPCHLMLARLHPQKVHCSSNDQERDFCLKLIFLPFFLDCLLLRRNQCTIRPLKKVKQDSLCTCCSSIQLTLSTMGQNKIINKETVIFHHDSCKCHLTVNVM